MKEKVFEMKRKFAVLEDFESQDIIMSELGMSIEQYGSSIDEMYNRLSEEDKEWVDIQLAHWYKEYNGFLGGNGCSAGNCSSCSGHHN
ncbi:MAG: hypothetical protein LDL13_06780 [Calditerrivibrio sp.]|nr:hypothetical protein [Calditerrivibrio sp.]MCA1980993.1 hypothetical protein [Calditerrivibrio sp.]